mmetsp:Transcript_6920/g.19232  ORF Transcript_6920/g.19232 Transcript_6920/m.19232 type:complete len:317 (+) Transcript_6920:750-1700(+)
MASGLSMRYSRSTFRNSSRIRAMFLSQPLREIGSSNNSPKPFSSKAALIMLYRESTSVKIDGSLTAPAKPLSSKTFFNCLKLSNICFNFLGSFKQSSKPRLRKMSSICAARCKKARKPSGSLRKRPRPRSCSTCPSARKFCRASWSFSRWPSPASSNKRFKSRKLRKASGSCRRWPRPASSKRRRRPAISSSKNLRCSSTSALAACSSASFEDRSSNCPRYSRPAISSCVSKALTVSRSFVSFSAPDWDSFSYKVLAALSSSMEGTFPRTVWRQTFNFRSAIELLQIIRVSTRSIANRLDTYGLCAGYSSEMSMPC